MAVEWREDRLQHPFLSLTTFAPTVKPTPMPTTTRAFTPPPPRTPYYYATESTPRHDQERQRAEEASRLWQRAEAAHAQAMKEATSLRQRIVDLESARARHEQLARDEVERRRSAEAAARARAKELAEERWRADEALRDVHRVEAERDREAAVSAGRDRELTKLETKVRDLESQAAQAQAALAREARALEEAALQKNRADAAEARAQAATREIELLRSQIKANLDAEHDRGEKAKDAIRARAARDRDRARLAELAAAEKAEELLQLWQRFKLLQREAADGVTPKRLLSLTDVDDDDVSNSTRDTFLRAKIDEARKGLASSQRKLERSASKRSSVDIEDGYVTPPHMD